ncbi:MAG: hypothetical protein IJN81_07500 [Clostridia bacterium]|nr:hypothetical protein [Clostridia bacterium]
MKKSFKKALAVIMSVVMLLGATSITSFAATEKTTFDDVTKAFSDWINALSSYEMSDFNEFVTAILGLFGFKGEFEGVHSIPSLVDEWFGWLGDIGGIYEAFINFISTSELLDLINGVLSK